MPALRAQFVAVLSTICRQGLVVVAQRLARHRLRLQEGVAARVLVISPRAMPHSAFLERLDPSFRPCEHAPPALLRRAAMSQSARAAYPSRKPSCWLPPGNASLPSRPLLIHVLLAVARGAVRCCRARCCDLAGRVATLSVSRAFGSGLAVVRPCGPHHCVTPRCAKTPGPRVDFASRCFDSLPAAPCCPGVRHRSTPCSPAAPRRVAARGGVDSPRSSLQHALRARLTPALSRCGNASRTVAQSARSACPSRSPWFRFSAFSACLPGGPPSLTNLAYM